MNIHIRNSRHGDEDNIQELLEKCFADEDDYIKGVSSGRYILACRDDTGELVAITGINDRSRWCREFDWTCTNPKYRNQGVMTKLLEYALSLVDTDIYYGAWCLKNKDRSQIQSILEKLGFELVEKCAVKWTLESCRCGDICNSKDGDDCMCYEDKWIYKVH